MSITYIETWADFEKAKENTKGGKILIIDFYADWCGPCRAIAPKLEAMAKEFEDKAVVCKVNVDEAEDVAEKCGISAMPTFHCYKNGDKVGELTGASEAKLKELFTNNI